MWKRLATRNQPKVTVGEEIRREFGDYFDKGGNWIRQILQQNPKAVMVGMVVSLVVSLIIVFLINVNGTSDTSVSKTDTVPAAAINIGGDNIGSLGEVVGEYTELSRLKAQVTEVLKKPKLTKADTLFLEGAIKRLETMQRKRITP